MRVLVIPDVHHKIVRVSSIIKSNNFDTIVSLGDWFDDFNDTLEMCEQTAEYLLQMYDRFGENFVWLLGNHDIPYMYPNAIDYYACSGVTRNKARVIDKVFNGRLNLLAPKLAYVVKPKNTKPIVLSHGGIHEYHFHNTSSSGILKRCDKAINNLTEGKRDELLDAGRARYGRCPYGGVTWLDWNREFMPIDSISQIVGHTPLFQPSAIDGEGNYVSADSNPEPGVYEYLLEKNKSININIDTHLMNYIILETNDENPSKITIKEYTPE